MSSSLHMSYINVNALLFSELIPPDERLPGIKVISCWTCSPCLVRHFRSVNTRRVDTTPTARTPLPGRRRSVSLKEWTRSWLCQRRGGPGERSQGGRTRFLPPHTNNTLSLSTN